MTKAEKAIDTLLDLGADPTAAVEMSNDPDDADWADCAPLSIATRLHFEDTFKRLYDKAVQMHGESPPQMFVEMAKMMPRSSSLERQIMHWDGSGKASHRMAKRLQTLGILTGQWGTCMLQDGHYLPLGEAIALMDLEVCKALLQDFYDTSPKTRDELFYACMLQACTGHLTLNESIDLLDFALRQGCNVNAVLSKTDHQWRAVDFLIEQHQTALLLWLLKFKPNLHRLKTTYSTSPLWQIIDDGLSQVVNIELLLQAGVDPNLQENNKSLRTPLHLAIDRNLLEDVRKLCDFGADPELTDASGTSPLQIALVSGNLEMLRELIPRLSVGRIDKPSWSGSTALSQAVALGQSKVAALLLEHGAKAEAAYPTAFHVAASEADPECMRTLLAASKNFDLKDHKMDTPLQVAIQSSKKNVKGAFNCAIALLEAGANPNTRNTTPMWAIHAVFRYFQGIERFQLVQLFHAKGAQLDVRDTIETTVLHLAAFMGDQPLVKFLLKVGLSPSLLGHQKQTPLHDCVRSFDQNPGANPDQVVALCNIIDMLVDAGAHILYQPYLVSRVDDSEVKSMKDNSSGSPSEASISLVGKNISENVKSSMFTVQEKLRAKKRLEQEGRASKVEGTGLLVFRDVNNLTPVEMAIGAKNGITVAAHLLKLHAETFRRLTAEHHNFPDSDIHWHEVVLESAAKKVLEAKNWAVVRHFIINELPMPANALSWNTAVALLNHALGYSDLHFMSIFLNRDVMDSDYPRLRIPSSRTPYPWPNILLPAEFCGFSIHLHNIVYSIRNPYQVTAPRDVSTVLDAHVQAYEGIQFHSVTDMLHNSWRIIRCMDLQTASYFFGNGNLNDLIYLVGISSAEAEFDLRGMPLSLAQGTTSTPLHLLYHVWMQPLFNPSRAKDLEVIVMAYSSLMKETREYVNLRSLDELEIHVNWLRLALNAELAKSRADQKSPNTSSAQRGNIGDDSL